jgi:uncharacterized protein YndB with AHSA1/START domain
MVSKNEFKPRMSDEAVAARTGKTWSRWFKHLDAAGAKKMTHQEIVAHLRDKHDVRAWWQQMVAVTYEQARGLRDMGEKPSGYEISVSRTVAVSASKAFKAWTDDKTRKLWLSEDITLRKSTANKTLRITWADGTDLVAAFSPKGAAKCQVVAQHAKLKDAKAATKMKKFWADALDRLKQTLE